MLFSALHARIYFSHQRNHTHLYRKIYKTKFTSVSFLQHDFMHPVQSTCCSLAVVQPSHSRCMPGTHKQYATGPPHSATGQLHSATGRYIQLQAGIFNYRPVHSATGLYIQFQANTVPAAAPTQQVPAGNTVT